MAWQPEVNVFIPSGRDSQGYALWRLWKNLITNGWVAMGSGDGLATYENDGDTAGPYDVLSVDCGLSSFNSSIMNSFGNTEAWFRVQHPSSTLEMVVKRSVSSPSQFVIAIDPLGFVNTGVANANSPPTGNKMLFLANSSGFTNYQSIFSGFTEDKRVHVMVNDAPVNGIHSFFVFLTQSGGAGIVRGGLWFHAMNEIATGDAQPWVAMGGSSAYNLSNGIARETAAGPRGFFDYGGGGELATNFPGMEYGTQSGTCVPGFLAAAEDGLYRHLPIVHASRDTGLFKGINAVMQWKATARNYPDTFDLAGGNPRVVVGDCVLPWASGVTPL